jgi:hypothetical protein
MTPAQVSLFPRNAITPPAALMKEYLGNVPLASMDRSKRLRRNRWTMTRLIRFFPYKLDIEDTCNALIRRSLEVRATTLETRHILSDNYD